MNNKDLMMLGIVIAGVILGGIIIKKIPMLSGGAAAQNFEGEAIETV